MKRLSLILMILAFYSYTFSQPHIEWQKSFGGNSNDNANSIQQTNDNGYIVAGTTGSHDGDVIGNHGDYDYWIVKLDPIGDIQWQKCLGGSGDDYASSIQQTSDTGYIVGGISYSNNGDVTGHHGAADYWIVKLNSIGEIQWQKSLGGSDDDYLRSIQQTSDGEYIVAGLSASKNGDISENHGYDDYWVVKLNSIGDIQWQKTLGGSSYDDAHSIQQTSDGGYIVAGASESNDGDVTGNHRLYDCWIVKLNSKGDIQWQKSLGGNSSDWAASIQQTKDGGYIIAGFTDSNDGDVTGYNGNWDYWIVKLDSNGAIQWQKSLGGSGYDNAFSINLTNDGGYIVTGESGSNDGNVTGHHGDLVNPDYWIVKLDSNGIIQWQKSLGSSKDDRPFSIQQTKDEGYIVAGYSSANDGDVTGNHGSSDYWIVKLSPDITDVNDYINLSINKLSISPNPTSSNSTISYYLDKPSYISLSLQSIFGENIIQIEKNIYKNAGSYSVELNTSDLPSGVYFCTLKAGNEVSTAKVMVIK